MPGWDDRSFVDAVLELLLSMISTPLLPGSVDSSQSKNES